MDESNAAGVCTAKIVASVMLADGTRSSIDLACPGGADCLARRIAAVPNSSVNPVAKTELARVNAPRNLLDAEFEGPCAERR